MPAWIWILVVLASLKIAAALPGFVLVPLTPTIEAPFPSAVYASHVVVFAAFGWVLVAGGRRDPRAQLLGALLLSAASLFANRSLANIPDSAPEWVVGAALVLRSIEPGAFRSLFVWLFASSFPRQALTGWWGRLASAGIAVSAALGVVLFALSIAQPLLGLTPESGAGLLVSQSPNGLWRLNTILTLLGNVLIIVNMRAAGVTDRRRGELLVWALVLGTAPILAEAVAESALPAYGAFMNEPVPRMWSGIVLYPIMWIGLATAAYAVYAREVLSVRLVVRRAIRYALARATIVALMAVPFTLLFLFLYDQRGEPLADILSGRRQLVLIGLVAAGLLLLWARRRLLDAVDRRFFREQYDAKRVLAALIDDTRNAHTVITLSQRLTSEIDRALHVESVRVFVADRRTNSFVAVDDRSDQLAADAALVTLLRGSPDPMDVHISSSDHPLLRLPEAERHWMASGAYRLLVPIRTGDGGLVGVLAVGRKKSELPFSPGDRWLLSAIGASAAVAIENITLRSSTPLPPGLDSPPLDREPAADAALECERCLTVQQNVAVATCVHCGAALREAPVPRALRGFRLDRRIGVGGMGVVYRAVDTDLQRYVAIKTLTAVSEIESSRLRREARAMAAVAHPNVATIFAVEMWRRAPLLIVEYFDHGTLRDRLLRQTLSPAEAIALGEDLCAGLQYMHGLGMLHRDIKPSNIAFAGNGSAKLLDFGLAKVVVAGLTFAQVASPDSTTALPAGVPAGGVLDSKGAPAGTPLYFSPEILAMQPADRHADLWALALVLYEAIAGRNPMAAESVVETVERIRRASVPDIREIKSDCPGEVAEFFAAALHESIAARPQTAQLMRDELRGLRRQLQFASGRVDPVRRA